MSSAIEVSLQWQDRILSVGGFRRAGSVSIGSAGADVYVPGLPGVYDLVELGSVTKLKLAAGMEAEVGAHGDYSPIPSTLREIFLLKDQTARLKMPGEKVSLVVRHAPPSPSALGEPVMDLGSDEFVALVMAIAVSMVLGLYVRFTPSGGISEEGREEAKVTRAKFIFDVVEPVPPPVQKNSGTGKSSGGRKTKPAQGDLLSTFASKGVSEILNRNLGNGSELTHMAGMATGRRGDPALSESGGNLKVTGSGADGETFSIKNGTGRTGDTGYSKVGGLGTRGRAEIQVSGSDGSFSGGMDREAIRRVIREHLPEIRNCYERALQSQPDLYGKLVLEWDIEAGGRVSRAGVKSNSLANSKVADCMTAHLRNWKFPEPPPNMTGRISYPLVFSAQ